MPQSEQFAVELKGLLVIGRNTARIYALYYFCNLLFAPIKSFSQEIFFVGWRKTILYWPLFVFKSTTGIFGIKIKFNYGQIYILKT